MWQFLALCVALFLAVRSGSNYLASDKFQEYADRTKAPWTCRVDYLVGQYCSMMSRYDDAARVLGRVSTRCPGTEVAEKADFERAHSLEVGGKRSDAAQAYGSFIEKYPNSRRIKLATRSYDLLK